VAAAALPDPGRRRRLDSNGSLCALSVASGRRGITFRQRRQVPKNKTQPGEEAQRHAVLPQRGVASETGGKDFLPSVRRKTGLNKEAPDTPTKDKRRQGQN
jgi:hypothetical protein